MYFMAISLKDDEYLKVTVIFHRDSTTSVLTNNLFTKLNFDE